MMSAVIVASIAIAVILGYKTKINTGLFCFAFAYIIGCFAARPEAEGTDCFLADQHDVRNSFRIAVL